MTKTIKCALAQSNFMLGDVEHNANKIIAAALKARDDLAADIVVFPELSLTGYPPEDLLLRTELQTRVKFELARIQETVRDIILIIGYPDQTTDTLYNAASVIYNSKILATYYKQHLPNYSVFDEKRYFSAGDKPCIINIKGVQFGITICEDLWQQGPFSQAVEAGAECIISLNASPFHGLKAQERQETFKERQQQEGAVPLIYVNCVGGQDELVFDGGSFCLAANGQCVSRSPLYLESLDVVTITPGDPLDIDGQQLAPTLSTEANIYEALKLGTRDYLEKNGFKQALVGLSGGIDSALTLAIAADALGSQRVMAVLMPSKFTADMSIEDAKKQCDVLGVKYHTLPIEPVFKSFAKTLSPVFKGLDEDVTEENLQARIRGVLLMAMSNKFGALLLTTGNKSEMAVGYATLYGDMCGGFAVLKDVKKTLAYDLSRYRNQIQEVIPDRVITRAPSAELRADQTDQDSLPDYEILDAIMGLYVEHNKSVESIVAAGFNRDDVEHVVRMISRNEYKRRQAAPGIRITKRAFGRDWRYPITSAYHKDLFE
jgi:NAD+ synthase (glutamine-hydrolysing)